MTEQFVGPCSWQIHLCWNTHLIALSLLISLFLVTSLNSIIQVWHLAFLELIGGHSLDINGVFCVWTGFGGCEEFLGGFCFCKDSTTACGAVWFRACWKQEKVPVDCVGFGSQPNTTLLQISCIFLEMIATGYMFRPATDWQPTGKYPLFPKLLMICKLVLMLGDVLVLGFAQNGIDVWCGFKYLLSTVTASVK